MGRALAHDGRETELARFLRTESPGALLCSVQPRLLLRRPRVTSALPVKGPFDNERYAALRETWETHIYIVQAA